MFVDDIPLRKLPMKVREGGPLRGAVPPRQGTHVFISERSHGGVLNPASRGRQLLFSAAASIVCRTKHQTRADFRHYLIRLLQRISSWSIFTTDIMVLLSAFDVKTNRIVVHVRSPCELMYPAGLREAQKAGSLDSRPNSLNKIHPGGLPAMCTTEDPLSPSIGKN